MLSVQIFNNLARNYNALDASVDLLNLRFSTHIRGYLECELTLRPLPSLRKMLLAQGGIPWVEITENGAPVWSGRVERVGGSDRSTTIIARGAYAAFTDIPYTGLHVMADAQQWRVMESLAASSFLPARFDIRINSPVITISPRKGEQIGGGVTLGGVYYATPLGLQSATRIGTLTFSYAFNAPTGVYLDVFSYQYVPSGAWTYVAHNYSLQGTGALQNGNATVTFGANISAIVITFNSLNPLANWSNDTGAIYLQISSPVVYGPNNPATSLTVLRNLITTITTLNSTLENTTSLIQSSKTLTDATYENARMNDIVQDVALISGQDGEVMSYGVYDDAALFVRPENYNGRMVWYTTAEGAEVERGLEDVYNVMATIYTDVHGNGNTSVFYTDALSVNYWGLTRTLVTLANSTTFSAANALAQSQLPLVASAVPTVKLALKQVHDANNVRFPLYCVRAGDLLVIQGLEYGDGSDTINSFTIQQTTYNCTPGGDTLTIELAATSAASKAFIEAGRSDAPPIPNWSRPRDPGKRGGYRNP